MKKSRWILAFSAMTVLLTFAGGRIIFAAEKTTDPAEHLLSGLDPEDYRGASLDVKNWEGYPEIYQAMTELMEGCETDADRISAVWDWMGTHYAYDYSLQTSDPDAQVPESERWLLETGNDEKPFLERQVITVCTGFAGDFSCYLRTLGIPALMIGNGSHDWNVVYLGGSWRAFDLTWSCRNQFYGAGDERNVFREAPDDRLYNLSSREMLEQTDGHHLPDRILTDYTSRVTFPGKPELVKEDIAVTRLDKTGAGIEFLSTPEFWNNDENIPNRYGVYIYAKQYDRQGGAKEVRYRRIGKYYDPDALDIGLSDTGKYVRIAVRPFIEVWDCSKPNPDDWHWKRILGDWIVKTGKR